MEHSSQGEERREYPSSEEGSHRKSGKQGRDVQGVAWRAVCPGAAWSGGGQIAERSQKRQCPGDLSFKKLCSFLYAASSQALFLKMIEDSKSLCFMYTDHTGILKNALILLNPGIYNTLHGDSGKYRHILVKKMK